MKRYKAGGLISYEPKKVTLTLTVPSLLVKTQLAEFSWGRLWRVIRGRYPDKFFDFTVAAVEMECVGIIKFPTGIARSFHFDLKGKSSTEYNRVIEIDEENGTRMV